MVCFPETDDNLQTKQNINRSQLIWEVNETPKKLLFIPQV